MRLKVPKLVSSPSHAAIKVLALLAHHRGHRLGLGMQRKRPQEIAGVTQDINVMALVKGKERYVFLYDDNHRGDALRTLGRFASNPELSFTWYDAAVLSQRIRQTAEESQKKGEEVSESPLAGPHSIHQPRFKFPLAGDAAMTDDLDDGTL